MKIALVNLCSEEDISTWSSYNDDINFLESTGISFVNYASGRSNKIELLEGFNKALQDEEVSVVWFVNGGTTLIQYLSDLDWEVIKKSKKKFIGLSDFTHFAVPASSFGMTSYYGLALKKITKYYSVSQRQEISTLLLSLIKGEESDLVYKNDKKIIGGHLSVAQFIINTYDISIRGKTLFLEYHYIPGENWKDFAYYIHQLCLSLKVKNNIPDEILLGHSVLFNDDGSEIEYQTINDFCKKIILFYFDLNVKEIDHFRYILKFD